MKKATIESIVYIMDDGMKRRLYRTERHTKKETPYFYIKNNKAVYLTAAEVSKQIPKSWIEYIPIRNN